MVAPGGADRSMLRVDVSRFKPRGRRRLVIWLLLIVLPVVGLLLGLFVPRAGTTIEFGSGSLFESSSGEISPVFLASEYHDTYTTLWLANAHDPDKRSRLADIPHAPGWDIEASVNPIQPAVAVLAIPPGGWDPASHASLLVISQDGVRHLATNLELRGGLLWSDDGRHLVAQRAGIVLVLDASSGTVVADWKPTRTHSAHPVAMTNDTLWVATLQSSGTAIAEVQLTESGPVTVERVKLSDGVTRDWTLSPDGSRLAFTEQRGLDLRVRVVSVARRRRPTPGVQPLERCGATEFRLLGRCRSERVAGLAARWSARHRVMGQSYFGDRIHVADCLGPTRRVASASLVGRQRAGQGHWRAPGLPRTRWGARPGP